MSYSRPADVRAALVPGGGETPVTDGPRTAASLEDEQLQEAIEQADDRINAYLAALYAVPVPVNTITGAVPGVVRALSRDIAAYLATLTFRKGKDLTPTDPVALRYADALTFLTAVSRGQATLVGVATSTSSSATGEAGTALNAYNGSLFTTDQFDVGRGASGTAEYGERAWSGW